MRLLVTPFFLALLLAGCVPAQNGSSFAQGSGDDAIDDINDNTSDDDDASDDDDSTDDVGPGTAISLADASSGGRVSGAELTFADDGVAFAAWVESTDDNGDIWLARSLDGGTTWQEPVPIETGPSPTAAGGERHPFVAVDEYRVAVVWTSNPDSATWVAIADRTDSPLSFTEPTAVGTSNPDDLEDYAKGVFLSDGELAVVTHITVFGGSPAESLFVTRESDEWDARSITSNAPGQPCACCSIDLLADDDGGLLVAYRNNVQNIRDHYVLAVEASGAVSWSRATFTNWATTTCPMQGPRLIEMNGELRIFWSDPTAGQSQIWMARSEDGGASWEGERGVTDASATGGQRWPRVGLDKDGVLHLVFHVGVEVWTVRSDDNITFSAPRSLDTPAGPLEEAELAIGLQGPALLGSAGDWAEESIWFMPIE